MSKTRTGIALHLFGKKYWVGKSVNKLIWRCWTKITFLLVVFISFPLVLSSNAIALDLLNAGFDTGADGFIYSDNTFRGTSQPSYSSGSYDGAGGSSGGGLLVITGGVDNNVINGMSGGWGYTFNLPNPRDVVVTFQYRFNMSGSFESNEFGEMLVSVDGTLYGATPYDYVFQHAGNGGPEIPYDDNGWQTFQFTIPALAGGNHDLILGAYVNAKDHSSELLEVYIDNVSVVAQNNPPTLVSIDVSSIDENIDTSPGVSIGTLSTTDPDIGDTFTYTIQGGADAFNFSIGGASSDELVITAGVLDFETKSSYEVIVRSTDLEGLSRDDTLIISVNDVNDAPVISVSATANVAENTTAVLTATATDEDLPAQTLTYSISGGGVDDPLFNIDSVTGALSFISAPDYETPGDFDTDNIYDVQISVSDGNGGSDFQDVAVTVTAANDAPVITSSATANISENTTAVMSVTATDDEVPPQILSYSISGGVDGGLFAIDSGTGALSFISAADYEVPGDFGTNNVYDVQVTVSDGNGGSDLQAIAITVTDDNDAPVVTSSATVNLVENTTAVMIVTTVDEDVPAQTMSYSISGGVDGGLFAIDNGTGALSFISAADYEVPGDFGTNNVYDVQVTVSDGNGGSDLQVIAVTVTDDNDAPAITSSTTPNIAENTTAVLTVTATDEDLPAQTMFYLISGGLDSALFSINSSSGVLSFTTPPDYEVPGDSDADNVYDVRVAVSDGNGGSDFQDIAVTVTAANDAPSLVGISVSTIDELTDTSSGVSVGTLTTTDQDPLDTFSYTVVGGVDQASFSIGGVGFDELVITAGVLDSEVQSSYEVIIRSIDSGGLFRDETLTITVNDLNDAPTLVFISKDNLDEHTDTSSSTSVGILSTSDQDVGDSFTYTIQGGADALSFTIGGAGDELFITAGVLDYEAKSTYDVVVRTTDSGGLFHDETLAILINDLNDAPVITSGGAGGTAENTTAVMTVTVSDEDVPPDTLSFSISGGVDGSLFAIGSVSGVLSFIANPDFENPQDLGGTPGDNIYDVQVTVSDGAGGSDLQTIAVTVSDTNDAPTLVSISNSTVDDLTDSTGGMSVGTLTSTDQDSGETFSYTVVGGVDISNFSIGGGSLDELFIDDGVLDFETQVSYEVVVRTTDSGALNHDETLIITVIDANDAPVISVSPTVNVVENTTAVLTATATDVDVPPQTLSYSITGGIDSSLFTIDSVSGDLNFITAPDFENPTDSGINNIYDVQVTVSDGAGGSDFQNVAVTVTDTNDAPVITSSAAINVVEETTAVITVGVTDEDSPVQTLFFSISGGVDNPLFSINSATGDLSFISAPDFENPSDSGLDNIYDVQVTVSDGAGGSDLQDISVSVTNDNDAPTLVIISVSTIDEQTDTGSGFSVGTLSTNDPDAGDTHTYLVVSGADQLSFSIGGAGLDELILTAGVLDFEVKPSYEVVVRSTDSGGLIHDDTLIISINDLNDAPVITSSATANVAENSTVVLTVTATDGDLPAQTLTYLMGGGVDSALFSLDSVTGALSFITAPDYESPGDTGADNIYDVQVAVSDGNGGTDLLPVIVTVTNENEAPTFVSISASAISDGTDTTGGLSVGTLTTTDQDAGGNFTYSIQGGADAANFSIGGVIFNELVIADGVLDFATQSTYQVTVRSTDPGGLTYDQNFTIYVTAGNVPPTLVSISANTINEHADTTGGIPVGTLSTTDIDVGDTHSYTVVGGAEVFNFSIGGIDSDELYINAGVLDFEIKSIFEVVVRSTDSGGLFRDEILTITVNDLNDSPTVVTIISSSIDEQIDTSAGVSVGTLSTTDQDVGDTFTYTVVGGADVSNFSIGGVSSNELVITAGVLNYEAKLSYQVVVRTTDSGGLFHDETLTITVNNLNDAPVITSSAAANVVENTTAVMTVAASDEDAASTVSFSISGGADQALFTINSTSGQLVFLAARDFENPADLDTNNIYEVEVTANDGNGGTDIQLISVTVTDVNEGPTLVSISNSDVADQTSTTGGVPVGTLTTADVDAGDSFTYAVVGGVDQIHFSIGGVSLDELLIDDGVLAFATQSSYEVVVRTTDSVALSHDQTLTINVIDSNDDPVITSSSTAIVPENTTAVTTVTATDVDVPVQTITFSITGGDDQALFVIDSASGALSFIAAPDYETPGDLDVNNIYLVEVTADDGNLGTDVQTISATVSNDNDAPTLLNIDVSTIDEQVDTSGGVSVGTLSSTDQDVVDTFTYSVQGGADAVSFSIGGGGLDELIITAGVLDYESKSSYEVVVRSTDAGGLFYDETLTITVNDLNDAPVITSGNTANVAENSTAVMTVAATDEDVPLDTLSYSINGGTDGAQFSINSSSGALSFTTAPDFENPLDVGGIPGDNIYDVQVTVSDGTGGSDIQAVAVTVTGVNDAPALVSIDVSTIDEHVDTSGGVSVGTLSSTDQDAGDTFTYTVVGGVDQLSFAIGGVSLDELIITAGVLDYEAKSSYDVVVRTTDAGNLFHDQSLTVTINDLNDAPIITSSATAVVVDNTSAVMTVTASDEDVPANTLSYSKTGGLDSALFSIDSVTGDLSFIAAPDFENPIDSGLDNIYDVQVTVSDGAGGSDVIDIAITVTDLNDAPTLVSIDVSTIDENVDTSSGVSVGTLSSTDQDIGDTFTYSVQGGVDQANFSIGGVGSDELMITAGVLDNEAKSSYDVIVRSTDSGGLFHDQPLTITVNDLNDAPVITSSATVSTAENTIAVLTITSTDEDLPAQTMFYLISGGLDSALFSINSSSGALSFNSVRDYEIPSDSGGDNIYDVQLTVSDGAGGSDVQAIAVTVTDANDGPTLVSISNSAVADLTDSTGGFSVGTLTTTDQDPLDTFTYSVVGGVDQANFSIGGIGDELIINDGVLDFETQSSYEVIVRTTDSGALSHDETFTITVVDVNDAPVITSSATPIVAENTTPVITVTATDADIPAQTVTFTITGGADQLLFSIDGLSGALSFNAAPDYEVPGDFDANNIYLVQVTADDGNLGDDVQTISITVTDANDAPVITSAATANVVENSTAVLTVTATDEDSPAQTLSYSISGGADSALFSINSSSGALSFIAAPNYESPADVGSNNVYEVEVSANDSNGGITPQTVSISVTDTNETPSLINISSSIIDENIDTTTPVLVGTLTTTDVDVGDTFTYTISGGADLGSFSIGGTGSDELFISDGILNSEAKPSYQVIVRTTDAGGFFHDETLTITVNDLNDNPVITSSATSNVAENTTAVMTVTATDADFPVQTVTFSLTGGVDQALFVINSTSGQLVFLAARDFETPFDFDFNNIYEVEVTASDGVGGTSAQLVNVTIADINESPILVSISNSSVIDQSDTTGGFSIGALTTTDVDTGDSFTYAVVGGADQVHFSIGGTFLDELFIDDGVVAFATQSSYEVTLRTTDSGSLSHDETLTINIIDSNDAPVITSNSTAIVAENTTAVLTVSATDVDVPVQTITFSITGGVDQALFTIDGASGDLTFTSAPDYEIPEDTDTNNIHLVEVTANDGNGGTDVQTITVTVTNANDNPTLVSISASTINENIDTSSGVTVGTLTTTDQDLTDTFTYTVVGGADQANFSIGGGGFNELVITAGILDFETKLSYDVVVRSTDNGGLFHDQTFTINVIDQNDNPVITSSPTAIVVDNTAAVMTVTATDEDVPAQTLSYSISGGLDGALFGINSTNGALSFNTAPDYEIPTDNGANNIYDVQVTVSDGTGGSDIQAVAVTVTDVNDAPTLVSIDVSTIDEHVDTTGGVSIGTLSSTDQDAGDTFTYTVVGGVDQANFSIGGVGLDELIITAGVLDYEAKSSYDVVVRTTDAGGLFHDQPLTITVNDLNDAPIITSGNTASVVDNSTAVMTVIATDEDVPANTLSYSVSGGIDGALFAIDSVTGDLSFIAAPDFENPLDAGGIPGDNIYDVQVTVADGVGGSDIQAIAVTVTDLNDAPTLVTIDVSAIDEHVDTTGGVTVGALSTTDQDAGDTFTYTVVGGVDQANFSIGGVGLDELVITAGVLDYEAKLSYDVVVRTTDAGGLFHDQPLTITVNDLNDAPLITSSAIATTAENTTAVLTVTSTDEDVPANTLSYSVSGGLDSALFGIDSVTGALIFNSEPDYEVPSDSGGDNIYDVQVTVSDGAGGSDIQAIAVTVTDANDGPTLVSISNSAVADLTNSTGGLSVGTLTTTDQDPLDTFTYSVVGGVDQANFSIGGAGDELFIDDGVLDFETQSSYQVIVQTTDSGALFHYETLTITVVDANDAPVITSSATSSVVENTTAVITVTATDADLPPDTITFSITGGADQLLFSLDGLSGALSFIAAPDFEIPGDADANNIYLVEVTADDGNTGTDVQTISVTVTDSNDAPIITSAATANVVENTTSVMAVTYTDTDIPPDTITFSLSGGADQTFFNINSSSGALAFNAAPDFEALADFDGDNVYVVDVTVDDGNGGTAIQTVNVTITNANETPSLINISSSTINENIDTTIPVSVGTLTTVDIDAGDTFTYTISGGADLGNFSIGGSGSDELLISDGVLNYEAKRNYQVIVRTTDAGGLFYDETLIITVNDFNDNPVITSSATADVVENTTAILTVTATDTDFPVQTVTFSLTGGADQALFVINSTSGQLFFLTARDYEIPFDFDSNNIYEVEVTANDGAGGTNAQLISVTITDINESPTQVSISVSSVVDQTNTTGGFSVGQLTTSDVDTGDTFTYGVVGGLDQVHFSIGGTFLDELFIDDGVLAFAVQSSYQVIVRTTDSGGQSHDETLTINVVDSNDAPVITSSSSTIVPENTTSVLTVTATDVDVPIQTITFSITGGDDQGLFSIDGASGALSFVSAPDYEIPGDFDSNNIYLVDVTANDGNGGTDVQTITVTVTDANDTPTLVSISSSTINENIDTSSGVSVGTLTTTDQDSTNTFTYTVVGGVDQANFSIGGGGLDELVITAGVLDFETKLSYDVVVRSTDNGGLFHDETLLISVNEQNDAPVITSSTTANAAENTTSVMTVTATDEDVPANILSYSVSGGLDSSSFSINSSSGALSFISTPDYETPSDSGANNIYDVQVTVSDGVGGTDVQAVAVTVTDANDTPTLVAISVSTIDEHVDTTAGVSVGTLSTTDQDPLDTFTYTVVGGVDQANFSIGGVGLDELVITAGVLDFEIKTSYDVVVRSTDGGGLFHDEPFTISVNDLNDAPVITSSATASVVDNTTAVITVTATDEDVPADTLSYSISGGLDSTLFTIDNVTGDLSFIAAPDFEIPTDSGLDNIYDVQVTVSDGTGGSDIQDIAVTVTDVNDAPTLVSINVSTIDEHVDSTAGVSVGTLSTTDQDASDTFIYTVVGGVDQANFSIGGVGLDELVITAGVLDYEAKSSYDVILRSTDAGGLFRDETFTINVNDLNDAPVITSSATASAAENTTSVMTVTATDEDVPANTLSYSISGGLDSGLFSINSSSGALSYITAQDYEIPADSGLDNIYDVQVTVSDGIGGSDIQALAVTVTDANDGPTLVSISNSIVTDLTDTTGGFSVGTLTTTDQDPLDTFTYTVVGGVDQVHFTIGGAGNELLIDDGVLDFETKSSYQVIVRSTDSGLLFYEQTLTITVVDVNDAPAITSSDTASVAENTTTVLTVTAIDADLPPDTITFSLTGGADQALFAIDGASGAVTFLAAPDYEIPGDTDTNNIYLIEVTANDGNLGTDVQTISVTVTDANDAPVITSIATANVVENTTSVMTVSYTDEDLPAQTMTFSVSGGADQGFFSINSSSGALAFSAAPDFETLADSDSNNVYVVDVTVDDGNGGTDIYTINVTVTNNNETPSLVSLSSLTINEDIDTTTPVSVGLLTSTDVDAGDTFIYTIAGGVDQGNFSIGGAGDELHISDGLLDYEAKSSYQVIVRTTDAGGLFHDETFVISINNLNDNPIITSNPSTNVAENTTSVMTVTATDEDFPIQTIIFSLTGGNDQALFAINGGSGQLVFLAAPDFEIPGDFDGNNTYEVEVTASDGNGGTRAQLISVTVDDANDAPTQVLISVNTINELIDSTGGVPVGTLSTIDVDAVDSFTYSVVGGADQPHFSIGGILNNELHIDDGLLDFETQFSYEVIVRTTDSGGLTHDETLTITVLDINDAPIITSIAGPSMPENITAAITVTATDADVPSQTLTFSITGGDDQSLFAIDSASGALSFVAAPDFETPADLDVNNVYLVEVTADDGSFGTDVQTISVTVTNANDAPTLISISNSFIDENIDTSAGISIGLLTTTDQDAGDTFIYTVAGGVDVGNFYMSGANSDELYITDGVLNFENKASYDVIIRSTDSGGLTYDENLTIIVNDLNDPPVGSVLILGTVEEDQILTANVSGLSDEDGLGPFSYQWQRNLTDIPGANVNAYTLGDADVATSMTVVVSYVDLGGTPESVTSVPTIAVVNVNDPPAGIDAAISPVEDITFNGSLTASDVDNVPADFIFSLVIDAVNGAVTVNGDGTFQFVPDPNFDGSDSFTFMVNDGTDDAVAPATITITMQPVNDPPVGISVSLEVNENNVLNGNLAATDIDNVINDFTFRLGSDTLNGSTIVNANGSFQYTPDPDFNGSDSFTFIVNDGTDDSLETIINITVIPENHPPIANDNTFATDVDVSFAGVLTGSDVDDDTLFYILETTGTLGTATITAPGGQFWYEPNPGAVGIDTFTFRVTDGEFSNIGTITVVIGDVNSVPIAHDSWLDVVLNTPTNGRLTASDFDDDTLTFSLVATGNSGIVTITDPATGTYTYTPFDWTMGTDMFTFKVNDGTDDSNIAVITVTIVPSPESNVTKLVSKSPDSVPGTGSSYYPALSSDGSFVAFISYAKNLVSGLPDDGTGQICIYDRMNNSMDLISQSTAGDPGDGTSDYPSINNDGQFIAFYSYASNLVAGDTNGVRDVFVHDRGTGVTDIVSVSTGGVIGNGTSTITAISNDGNFVAFQSEATNFIASDANGTNDDIFIRNRLAGTTELVSLSTGGVQSNRVSEKPSISADGRFVAFQSQATNLVAGSVGQQIYVRDLLTNTLTQVSVSSAGVSGNGASGNASISADGRFVVFQSTSSSLVTDDTNGVADIFVHDRQTGTTERVNISSLGEEANGTSECYFQNSISADGQFIVFHSDATNLVADTNGARDVFINDRSTGYTRRLSTSSLGQQGNDFSWWPSISADGLIKSFSSGATNLVDNDNNSAWDVFLIHPFGN